MAESWYERAGLLLRGEAYDLKRFDRAFGCRSFCLAGLLAAHYGELDGEHQLYTDRLPLVASRLPV